MIEPSSVEIRFRRDPLMGLWTWRHRPRGTDAWFPGFGIFASREAAEASANRMLFGGESEVVSGEELRQRVEARKR